MADYTPPLYDDIELNFTEGGYIPGEMNFNFAPEGPGYRILAGTSNSFVAIWADPSAGLNSGRFYVSAADAMSVVDLENKQLRESYLTTGADALISNDVVDINITGA